MSSASTSRQPIEFSISAENFTEALFYSLSAKGFAHGNHEDWLCTVKGIEGLIPLVLTERKRATKVKKGIKFKVYGAKRS